MYASTYFILEKSSKHHNFPQIIYPKSPHDSATIYVSVIRSWEKGALTSYNVPQKKKYVTVINCEKLVYSYGNWLFMSNHYDTFD